MRVIPRRELDAWIETLPPARALVDVGLPAARGARRRAGSIPVAGAAGPGEKRAIALALARATGVPLVGVGGRPCGRGRAC